MYANNIDDKYSGPLSIGIPGEIAGLHEAWLQHGRLPWKKLFQPAIKLAKDGFIILPYLGQAIAKYTKKIIDDPGLRAVFAPNGKLLQTGDTCYNVELANSLETIVEQGPQAFYNGTLGENLIEDVRKACGLLTMDDLKNYKVDITEATTADVMGYTIYGMPPPSAATLGYGTRDALKGDLGLHRLIEALKHMYTIRMNLADPEFVDIKTYTTQMLSPSFAAQIRRKIVDKTTFPPEYYMARWSQLRDQGTSHFCIVDADRNAVLMTTTINNKFGAGILSRSTGIVLNNEMGDFSAPTKITPDMLPPAPANYIKPKKRPLSSMSPKIVTKLIPNTVMYENRTLIDGEHIELAEETKTSLRGRGHELKAIPSGAVVQLVVQNLENLIVKDGENKRDSYGNTILHGILTAVSDPRKDGRPAAI